MLATHFSLLLVLLLGASTTYAATQIINASDPSSALTFSTGWTQQFSQITAKPYQEADGLFCQVAITLPPLSSSVQYIGFLRAGPTSYGYTLDCEQDCVLQTFNATDDSVTDDATAPQATLFSLDVDPSTRHTLRVYNLPTSSASSPITFDHLSVLVQDNAGIATTAPSSIPVSSSGGQSSLTPTTSTAVASDSLPSSGGTNPGTAAPTSTLPSSLVVLPVATSSVPGVADPASSNASSALPGSGSSGGVSKHLVIGLTILAAVVACSVVAAVVVFLRQRREEKSRRRFQGPLPSPTSSLIPIMAPPPPEMRIASMNPFEDSRSGSNPSEDPFVQVPLDNPVGSSLMQRRMDSRSISPGSAPTIPLPQLPPNARTNLMQSRSHSPASSSQRRSDLWVMRTPVKTEFYAV